MSAFTLFASAQLPQHCEPTNHLLRSLSAALGTCIPTPLAALSSLLGALSILSWLCAQLPQIVKNYRLKSTSGLSIYFLGEWCLGDFSNLSGALLTRQAAWQVIIGAYYCFVDLSLVIQWFWYEKLRHGRRMRGIWRKTFVRYREDEHGDMREVIDGVAPLAQQQQQICDDNLSKKSTPLPTPIRTSVGEDGFFRMPRYTSSPPSSPPVEARKAGSDGGGFFAPANRQIRRLQDQPLPSPSPRTVLFLTFIITLASTTGTANANPLHHHGRQPTTKTTPATAAAASLLGPLLSWLSTFLYLTSRLPQLVKNARLRSTAGLSPQLFAAAFCGNLFYSTSMICNPQAWNSYPAHGAGGWVGAQGSDRGEWIAGAAPFFLGAAGVLMLDLLVGVQFWMYATSGGMGGVGEEEEVVLVVEGEGSGSGRWQWKEVSGWMRGWKPSISRVGTPVGSREGSAARSLLGGACGSGLMGDGSGSGSGRGGGYGGV